MRQIQSSNDNPRNAAARFLLDVAQLLLRALVVFDFGLFFVHFYVNCDQSMTLGIIQLCLGLAIIVLFFITKRRWALYVGILFVVAVPFFEH